MAATEDKTPEPAKRKAAWAGWRGPAIATSMAGMIIAMLFASWFLLQRSQIDTSYTAETEIAVVDEFFEQFSPEELSMAWNNFQELGIGPKNPPDYFRWNVYAERRVYLAKLSGTIAAFFGLVSLGIWLSARTSRG